jgi:hypothetical protein
MSSTLRVAQLIEQSTVTLMGGRLQSKTEGAYLAPCFLILQSSKGCPLHKIVLHWLVPVRRVPRLSFRRSLASGKEQSRSPSLRSSGRNARLWDNPLPEIG